MSFIACLRGCWWYVLIDALRLELDSELLLFLILG